MGLRIGLRTARAARVAACPPVDLGGARRATDRETMRAESIRPADLSHALRKRVCLSYARASSRYSGSRGANRYYLGYGQRQGPRGWKATASRAGESQQDGSQLDPLASTPMQNPFDNDDELALPSHPRQRIGPP